MPRYGQPRYGVIGECAITDFVRKIGAEEFFQSSVSMGYVQYAFTKDCPDYHKETISAFMVEIEEAFECDGVLVDNVFTECPMNVVTRDTNYWNK